MMDSRNTANRSNKPIASQLAKGGHKNIRISRSGDSDEDDDEDDDDAILAGESDLRSGEYGGGKKVQGGGLAQMKAKLSLQEELGALKSELSNFESSITKNSSQPKESTEDPSP